MSDPKKGDLNQSIWSIFNTSADLSSRNDPNYNYFLDRENKKERINPSFMDLRGTYFGLVCAIDDQTPKKNLLDTVYTAWTALRNLPADTATPGDAQNLIEGNVLTARVWIPEADSVCNKIILPGTPAFDQNDYNKKVSTLPKFVNFGGILDELQIGDIVAVEFRNPTNPSEGGKILDKIISREGAGISNPSAKKVIEGGGAGKVVKRNTRFNSSLNTPPAEPKNASEQYDLKQDDGWSDKFNISGVETRKKQTDYNRYLGSPSYGKIAILRPRDGRKWGDPSLAMSDENLKRAGGNYNKELYNYYRVNKTKKFTKNDSRISTINMQGNPIFADAVAAAAKNPKYILYCHKYVELPLRMVLNEIKLKVENKDFIFKIKTTDTNLNRNLRNNLETGDPGYSAHHWGLTIDINGWLNDYINEKYTKNHHKRHDDPNTGKKFTNGDNHRAVRKAAIKDFNAKSGHFNKPHTITKEVIAIFGHYGWLWGGIWPDPDLMHFVFFGDPEKAEMAYYKGLYNVIAANVSSKINPSSGLPDLVLTGGTRMKEINQVVEERLRQAFQGELPDNWSLPQ